MALRDSSLPPSDVCHPRHAMQANRFLSRYRGYGKVVETRTTHRHDTCHLFQVHVRITVRGITFMTSFCGTRRTPAVQVLPHGSCWCLHCNYGRCSTTKQLSSSLKFRRRMSSTCRLKVQSLPGIGRFQPTVCCRCANSARTVCSNDCSY